MDRAPRECHCWCFLFVPVIFSVVVDFGTLASRFSFAGGLVDYSIAVLLAGEYGWPFDVQGNVIRSAQVCCWAVQR
jgi:hypothetical protein